MIALQGLQGPDGALNRDLIVVLDGGSARLEQAGRYRQQVLQEQPPQGRRLEPEQLLIRCPRTPPPPPSITGLPLLQLLEGYDTATQITALSGWLQRRQGPPPQRLWPALPWLVVASRFSQTHRHLPAPASTASSSATPCAPDRCPQAGRLRGVGLRPRESRLNVDREREPTARRAQRQAQCNLVQLRHQLEPSDPTPNVSEM